MSDKERLQEIKESWVSEGHLAKIDREHFDWLIEQVEKAEELVQSLNDVVEMAEQFLNDKHFYMDELKKTEQQLQQAQAKIERYEKALNHWNTYFDFSQPVPKDLNELGTQKGVQRCFDIARQALEESK